MSALHRRALLRHACAAALLAPLAAAAGAAAPLRLVVPFAAGGPADTLARAVAPVLAEQLGQPVLVDNRPGAGGLLGAAQVARAAPDGQTLLLANSSTHSIAPLLQPRPAYDPLADFTPLAALADAPGVVLVPRQSPARTLDEFIALARRQPGRLSYGSSGHGTIVHLATEDFKARTGTYIVHIPYRGTALALADLAAGTIDLLLDSLLTGLAAAQDGRVRALAVTSAQRSPLAPGLPAVAERLPGFEAVTWFGLVGPRGLPAEQVTRLNQAVQRTLADPALHAQLARLGAEPTGGSPDALARRLADEARRWRAVIAARGITAP